ncbi:PEBP-like protein [Xylariaceae sp. FL0804]|nr:PEBP-like protein [Xylariaceae sp. FL0804]
MLSRSLALLAAASGALAQTPKGFEPSSETSLLVTYGETVAADGDNLKMSTVKSAPAIGTQKQLAGSSFAVIMVDLDIPTGKAPGQTTTYLHWLQQNLTQDDAAAAQSGSHLKTYQLQVPASGSPAAYAAYVQPAPPAQVPLSHVYAQILVDTSDATETDLAALKQAAQTRVAFDPDAVLTHVGLAGKVVAGNYYNVTNPGPVSNSTTTSSSSNSTSSSSSTSSSAATTTTAAATTTGSTAASTTTAAAATTTSPAGSGAVAQTASGLLLSAAMLGAAALLAL